MTSTVGQLATKAMELSANGNKDYHLHVVGTNADEVPKPHMTPHPMQRILQRLASSIEQDHLYRVGCMRDDVPPTTGRAKRNNNTSAVAEMAIEDDLSVLF